MAKPMRVLIVDDDEVDRLSMVRAMQQAVMEITLVQTDTAAKGLNLARESVFDVVLLDFRLPDRDGIEVLKELKCIPDRHMTVVMLSHQDDLELAQRAIGAGAQDFLLKEEVTARLLLRTVYQAQHRHALEEDLRRSHERLRVLAERDSLTGLANRYDFDRALRIAVGCAQRKDRGVAILLLDIDHFKEINDNYGHAMGDQMLISVARRLEKVVRDSDVLARLGGDEFVVLLQDMLHDEQPALLASRIIEAFVEPMRFDTIALNITASIGIACFGADTADATTLLKCADIAMYRAKREGRNQSQFYSYQMHLEVRTRAELKTGLHCALALNQFRVFYQAQIDGRDGSLVGMEALIRWQHPQRGLLGPASFLTQAEEMGLMPAIGRWVMQEACQQLQSWRLRAPQYSSQLSIAVNLSAVQLQAKDLLETIDRVLLDCGLPPEFLELEITESALIKSPEEIANVLNSVSARGVRLALDDFGTGYSSFEHLRLFPIHRLKIDQTFVAGIGKSPAQDRLLHAMVSFGKALGLTVIAEGVETAAHANFCRDLGCDWLQGYHFSKPVSAEEFEAIFLTQTLLS